MFACRNCGLTDRSPVYRGVPDRFHRLPGSFDYVRCTGCGLVQLETVPANLADHYGDYRVHAQDSRVYHLLRKLTIGHSYPVGPGHGALLDYGCGNGWFCREMQRLGWQAFGYEPDAAYARSLADTIGLPVLSGEESLRGRTFAMVTFNFSFEHLDRPKEALRLAASCLEPGGRIHVAVPNIESREARVFGEHWFHLDPPRHISFFTKRMLTEALEVEGFGEVSVRDLPVPTGLAGSLSYKLAGRLHPALWYGGILPGLAWSRFVRDGNFAAAAIKR